MQVLVTSERDLLYWLKQRRKQLGLTQLELDDKAGFQDGYTGKLEAPVSPKPRKGKHPKRPSCRRATTLSLEWWIKALGAELVLWLPD